MTRAQWYAAYREARKAARLYSAIKAPSLFATLDLCPGFDFTRLHGDRLSTSGLGHRGMVTHKSRMHELRRNVRLPK